MSEPPIEDIVVVRDLTRTFGDVQALAGVSLMVQRGTVVAIRGDSGSGKSTLLSIVGGLDAPESGSVTVDGQELGELSRRQLVRFRAEKVGFVFQAYHLMPWMTALENVALGMEPLRIGAGDREDRALEALRLVGLRKRAHHRPGQLSGGEQQRVAIARAVAKRPTLLLADEPTGNLDRKSRNVIVDYLLRASRETGATAIIVTHDPNVAARCDIEHKLKDGRITKRGQLRRAPQSQGQASTGT